MKQSARTGLRRIVSWNVNGLRACIKKGFLEFLESSGADVVGIQELRAMPDQLPLEGRAPSGWHAFFSPAVRKGYSGVALYTRQAPTRIETALGIDEYDIEGRLIIAHFGRMTIANAYFPKGSGTDRDNSRVPYKLGFYAAVFERLQQLRRRGRCWRWATTIPRTPNWTWRGRGRTPRPAASCRRSATR